MAALTKKRQRPVEYVTGMDLASMFCPNCGSTNLAETETEIKCSDCNMGKYKNGR